MFEVYDETDRERPRLQYWSSTEIQAKNYIREIMDRISEHNSAVEFENDEIWRTLVIRNGKRLVFLASSAKTDFRLSRVRGGLSIKSKPHESRGPLMISMPGMGGGGYSSDALKVRYEGDRSGRRENDMEVQQDYGPTYKPRPIS